MKIANAAGFLGDQLDAPRRLVESAGVDYLTLEYLAELTMSILARLREKDPQAGYAADFLTVLESLPPALKAQPQLKIVTNAGGMNPHACARAAGNLLAENGLGDVKIGVASGDDLLARLEELQSSGCPLAHLDSGRPLRELTPDVVSANAYLGAGPIVEALSGDARIVITGRVADASLTVGPAVREFGWTWRDYDLLAAASVAGHLIECGAQVTGGFYTHWPETELADVGYPIAELSPEGGCVITKPAGGGGVVNRMTVCEQLVYEIGDPAHYLTPDVDVDFTGVTVEETGPDRVSVRGTRGNAPPEELKVSLAYRAGFTAWGQLLVWGRDCRQKANTCADIVRSRLRAAGCEPEEFHVELLGAGDAAEARETLLRIAVADPRREAVERFTRELTPLATSGPAGLAGYTSARGPVRPVFAYWPTTVPKECVRPEVEVRTASEWCAATVPQCLRSTSPDGLG